MKKKSLIFVLILTLVLTLSLTACAGGTQDPYVFKVEGVEGYSDAVINAGEKTISFMVKETYVDELPLSIIKVPEGTIMKAYLDKDKKNPIDGD